MSIYPWQTSLWHTLMRQRGRMHHALLIQGRAGLGKLDFAMHMAQSMLCQSPDAEGHACGLCVACNWFVQNTHPDLFVISPESETSDEDEASGNEQSTKKGKKSQQISVTQVRELTNSLELTGHVEGGSRVVLIYPAESLNVASANAILKLLEEPPQRVQFLLVSHQPQRLLPTILSRCQKLEMPTPSADTALSWLKSQGLNSPEVALHFAGGAPLVARSQLAQQDDMVERVVKHLSQGKKLDAFALPNLILSHGMDSAIQLLQKWIYDLVLVKMTGDVRYYLNSTQALKGLAIHADLNLLLQYQRKLDDAKKSASHPLNNELQLEAFFVQYTQLFTS